MEEMHVSIAENIEALARTKYGDLYGLPWNDVGVYLFRIVDAMLQGSSDPSSVESTSVEAQNAGTKGSNRSWISSRTGPVSSCKLLAPSTRR